MRTMMSEEEKLNILLEVVRLRDEGKDEEADAVMRTYPIEPEMAQICKDVYGEEFLSVCAHEYDMSEVEARYGKEWFNY